VTYDRVTPALGTPAALASLFKSTARRAPDGESDMLAKLDEKTSGG
jgi:hypothetical protein